MLCDNQSAIDLTNNPKCYERIKHIDGRVHFIWDVITQGAITVKKIATVDDPTDMMTNYSSGQV